MGRLCAFALVLVVSTGWLFGCQAPATRPDAKQATAQELERLGQGLGMETWERVRRFFDGGYYGGTAELRDRLERRWRNEQLLELQFVVNRVLRQGDLLSATVHWNKSYLDASGAPHKASGDSEILLRPVGDGLRIITVHGDQFF